jgi:hypothetical protein
LEAEELHANEEMKMAKKVMNNPFPPEYFCPMCPDHYDEVMVYSDVLDTFVCSDCYDIIGEVLMIQEEDVDCDFQYRKNELEHISGKSYLELRRIFLMQRYLEEEQIIERFSGCENG